MAEARGDKSKKILSFATKKARRVQQKMLQKVGQAERTTDDNYTEFVVNFNKQQLAAARLQKELAKYSSSLKAVSVNTKSFMDLWLELYEPEWKGYSEVQSIVQQKMLLWEDILRKVQNDLMEPLQLYMSKFPETKKLIEKRERKIVDYDYAKREMEAARQSKKVNELKVQQTEEAFHDAKSAFDEVTDNLYEDLPALFDSRIEFYASFFRNMSSIEAKFHEEMTKLDESYNETMNELHTEAESGVHTSRKERVAVSDTSLSNLNPVKTPPPADDEDSIGSNEDEVEDDNASESAGTQNSGNATPTMSSSGKGTPTMTHSTNSKPPKPVRSDDIDIETQPAADDTENEKDPPSKPVKPPSVSSEPTEVDPKDDNEQISNEEAPTLSKTEDASIPKDTPVDETAPAAQAENDLPPEAKQEENAAATSSEVLTSANEPMHESSAEQQEQQQEQPTETDQLPTQDKSSVEQVLYKVVASHPYSGEDEDELSFEKGEVICVIPYDNPDDEEEGWKMGFIESTGQRGIFPENFTKPSSD